MKLSILAVAVSALCATASLLNPQSSDSAVGEVSPAGQFVWPEGASTYAPRRRSRTAETNAQRLARGQNPSRPRKLFDGRTPQVVSDEHGMVKRLSPAPSGAMSVGGQYYVLQGCYSQVNLGPGYVVSTLTYTSLQDLVNQCAGRTDQQAAANANAIRGFLVGDYPGAGNCGSGAQATTLVACTTSNAAAYVLSP